MADFTVSSQPLTTTTAILRMAGDMTTASFATLEDEFNKILDGGILGMVVDISALDSLTSSGLGALINLSQILEDRKGKAVIAAPRPKVLGLFEMLGVKDRLTIADTPDQARKVIASLKLQ